MRLGVQGTGGAYRSLWRDRLPGLGLGYRVRVRVRGLGLRCDRLPEAVARGGDEADSGERRVRLVRVRARVRGRVRVRGRGRGRGMERRRVHRQQSRDLVRILERGLDDPVAARRGVGVGGEA
eukprot:scaffold28273_cov34-Phaeocystis_antarctica.AAC.1